MQKPDTHNAIGIWDRRLERGQLDRGHPGGRMPLWFLPEGDHTVLFESTHHFAANPAIQTAALQMDPQDQHPLPLRPTASAFLTELRSRTAAALNRGHGYGKATPARVTWYVLVAIAFVLLLPGYWSGNPWNAAVLAVTGWFVMGMGHDAAHFAVSRGPAGNLLGWMGVFAYANPVTWFLHHTVGHHNTANLAHDPDLAITYPAYRSTARHPWRFWHKWQRLWIPICFCFSTWTMAVTGPPRWLWAGKVLETVAIPKHRAVRAAAWLLWLATVAVFLMMPIALSGIGRGVQAIAIYYLLSGLIFSIFVQVSHMGDDCFAVPITNDHWEKGQVESTMNFGSGGFSAWSSNGVSHQIEHHIFPAVNPCWYPTLEPLVRQVCAKHDVRYKQKASFAAAVRDMWQWFGHLAAEPSVQEDGAGSVVTRREA